MKLRLLGLLFCALPLSTFGQTYLYNQAVVETGKAPIAVVTGDFNRDGQLDLAVVNQADNTVSVILSKTGGTFSSKVDYPVGASPIAIVSGDFNGDGLLDLAVANSGDNSISVLLGSASGTFSPQHTFPTGTNPVSIVAVDLNSDKKLDLAAANKNDGTISILLGNGDGTFAGQTSVTVASGPSGLAAADFTGDGVPDLAVATSGGNLALLTNTGQGTFSATTTNVAPDGGALAAGDLNNDGKPDLVFAGMNSSDLTILIGDGKGNFQSTSLFSGQQSPFVVLGDFDNDGNLDIASVGGGGFPTAALIFRGNGDGTFLAPIPVGFAAAAPGLALGDFNHDNYLDLVGVDPIDNDALILLGDGKGNLTTRTDVTLPTLTNSDPNAHEGIGGSGVADVNHDGKMDVVTLQYTQNMQGLDGFITVLPGNGDGTFRQAVTSPVTNFGIGQMILGDFNADGKIDVATSQDPTTGLVSVVLGNGDGSFGPPIANPVNLSGLVIQEMIGGDFNKDGKYDLAATMNDGANSNSHVYIFTSNGDGTFQPHLVDTLPVFAPGLATGDFNHDGNLDLVALDDSGAVNPSVFVYLGKGDGTFSSATSYSTGSFFTNTVQAADFNGDGKVDITVGTEQGLYFFPGNGDGTFQSFVKTATPFSVVASFFGDFSGDNKPDIAATGNGNIAVNLLISNGDGTFQAPAAFQTPFYPQGTPTMGDFNADGTFDLVQVSSADLTTLTTQTLSLWRSVPTISFSAPWLDFATQSAGTSSASSSITLVNNGNAPLSVSKVTASASFAQTNNCTSPVATGQSCTVNVTFTPMGAGPVTGTLVFNDNAYPTTQLLVLTGTGNSSDFTISASPSSSSISAGAAATYTATLAPMGGFTGTVQLACAGAPTKATCTLSKSSVTLEGTNSVNVTVTVTTTAPAPISFLTPSLTAPFGDTFRPSALWVCVVFLSVSVLVMLRTRRLAAVTAFSAVAFALVACGGGNSSGGGGTTPGTPSGTYSLKITGADGGLAHDSTVSLTVQ